MTQRKELESEIKALLVQALSLEDMRPEDIDSRQALFGEGLGLDSIDALELAMALSKKYQIKVDGKAMDYRTHFSSVHYLTAFVAEQKGILLED